MNNKPPKSPKKMKKAGELDLLQLPLLRDIRPITTQRHKRESIGLLFNELAACVRQNLPLPTALDKIQSGGTTLTLRGKTFRMVLRVILIVLLVVGLVTLFFAVFLSGTLNWESIILAWVDVPIILFILYILNYQEDYLKFVAYVLSREMNKGKSLYQAMLAKHHYFEPLDLSLVRSGEQSGKLGETLKMAARYNTLSNRQPWTPYLLFYILEVLIMGFSVTILIFSKAMPRMVAIYTQMGVELPYISRILSRILTFFFTTPFGTSLGVVFILLVSYLLAKHTLELFFLSGWFWGTLLLSLFIAGIISLSIYVIITSFERDPFRAWTNPWHILFPLMVILVGVHIAYQKIRGVPVGWWRKIIHSLPFTRKAMGPLFYSRFLYTLSVLIQAGQPLTEALRFAGEAAGDNRTQSEAEKLSSNVEKGIPLKKALEKSRILTPKLRSYLSVATGTNQLAETCRRISEEQLQKLNITGERAKVCLRIGLTVILGIIALCIALTLYLPVFEVSTLIVTYKD